MTKSKKTSVTRQKWNQHASRSLLCIRCVAVAFRSEEDPSWAEMAEPP